MAANPVLIALFETLFPDEGSTVISPANLRTALGALAAAAAPAGGEAGQILSKVADGNNDYSGEWIDAPTVGEPEPGLTFHHEGNWPSGTLPTEVEIEAMITQDYTAGGAKIIQFTNPGTDQRKVFAYPATEADPTTYYIGPLDNGTLGSGGTFATPITVGAYRVIMSNYATTIPDPVTFS